MPRKRRHDKVLAIALNAKSKQSGGGSSKDANVIDTVHDSAEEV